MYKKNAGNIHKYVNDHVLKRIVEFNTSHKNWELIDNKIIFSNKMSQIPNSVPMYLGKIEKGFIYNSSGQETPLKQKNDLIPILENLIETHKVVFIKKNFSYGGKEVFKFDETSYINLENINIHGHYLLQKGVDQHEALDKINPYSINTLRVITLNLNGEIIVKSCALRMSINKSYKDNASSVGIFISYDLENNRLGEVATKNIDVGGKSYYKHPETQFIFKGRPLPYPDRVKTLVTRAATTFPNRYVVGWDVAYTPKGPILIEGNTNPGPIMAQIALKGLRSVKIFDDIYRELYN